MACHFVNLFYVKPLKETDRIVSGTYLDGIQHNTMHNASHINVQEHFSNRRKSGSYNERHHDQHFTWLDSARQDELFPCGLLACTTLADKVHVHLHTYSYLAVLLNSGWSVCICA